MKSQWTRKEIEYILEQLDRRGLPFKRYCFSSLGEGMELIGEGASGLVLGARLRTSQIRDYVIKVVGFGEGHVDLGTTQEIAKAQRETAKYEDNIVKVYAISSMRVWLDHTAAIVDISMGTQEDGKGGEGDFLDLQFIVMERLVPVIGKDALGNPQLQICELADGDGKEVIKLVYDIANALRIAHGKGILHRDVKLENVFYDVKKKRYKLGDFGIAKITTDGMARTVAYTDGYGAPEVKARPADDRYDATADIYSLGILLYLLLNDLRYPGSMGYKPVPGQYVDGFIVPAPAHGSDALTGIAQKMCSFDPDERYQSMEEVQTELDRELSGARLRYEREHNSLAYALSAAFLLAGLLSCKLTWGAGFEIILHVWGYILCALGIVKGIAWLANRNAHTWTLFVLVAGIVFLATSGVSVSRIILIILMTISSGSLALLSSLAVLWVRLLCMISDSGFFQQVVGVSGFSEMRWLSVLLLSLSCVMLMQYELLKERGRQKLSFYFRRDVYWIFVGVAYLALIVTYLVEMYPDIYVRSLGIGIVKFFRNFMLWKTGIAGAAFSAVWFIREKILSHINSHI